VDVLRAIHDAHAATAGYLFDPVTGDLKRPARCRIKLEAGGRHPSRV
jgi:hypothetical protein